MRKTKQRNITLAFMLVLFSLVISACGSAQPTVDINMEKTGFAETANVQGTMTSEAQPTATQTLEPTSTLTPTPENTPTQSPTSTEEGGETPTATAFSTGDSDAARYMSNIPADNTKIAPGEAFTVTWKLENIGTSTWTTNYYIQFASGEQMGAIEKVFLPYPVPPNTNVEISVDFVAPQELGDKQSNWKLFNANDAAFSEFWVIITVSESQATQEPEVTPEQDTPTPTLTETVTLTPTLTPEP